MQKARKWFPYRFIKRFGHHKPTQFHKKAQPCNFVFFSVWTRKSSGWPF